DLCGSLSQDMSCCRLDPGSILVPSVDSYQIHEFSEDTDDSRDLRKLNDLFLSRRASLEHWYIERLYLDSIVVGHRRKGWNVNDTSFGLAFGLFRIFFLIFRRALTLLINFRTKLAGGLTV